MHGRRVTQLEVARRAGVSRTTASFVLSGRDDMRISPEAQERVLQAARNLGYRPNLMARALRTKITHTVALISDTIATEPYAGQVVHGALAAAAAHGYVLLVGETEGDPKIESRLVNNFLDRQVDGFVYASGYTRLAEVPAGLRGHPLVLLNCLPVDRQTVTSVIPDELAAGRRAARTLLEHGHGDRIALVGEPAPHVFAGRERVRGIEDELADVGQRLATMIDCGWHPRLAFEAVDHALHRGLRPTALICLNDRIALGAYQALERHRMAIPTDVSVLSFDGSDLGSWLRPELTSIALPHAEMGQAAIDLVLSPEPPYAIHRVPMPLVERRSVGPAEP